MTDKKQGCFIAVEGIDGAGKSTQVKRLCRALADKGLSVVKTFEPTDGAIGRLIRQMLSGNLPADQRTITSLFAADRTDHLVRPDKGLVKQVQEEGKIVVCDRYYFSSYAYHSLYVDMEWVIQANRINADILRPCATLFIDVSPKVCLERIKARGGALDIYEKLDIMEAVRGNYLKAFDRLRDEETVIVIDGNASEDVVLERLLEQAVTLIGTGK